MDCVLFPSHFVPGFVRISMPPENWSTVSISQSTETLRKEVSTIPIFDEKILSFSGLTVDRQAPTEEVSAGVN